MEFLPKFEQECAEPFNVVMTHHTAKANLEKGSSLPPQRPSRAEGPCTMGLVLTPPISPKPWTRSPTFPFPTTQIMIRLLILLPVAEDKPSKTISTPTTREPGSASCSTETVLVPTERRKSLVPTKALKPSKRSPFVSFEVRTMMGDTFDDSSTTISNSQTGKDDTDDEGGGGDEDQEIK